MIKALVIGAREDLEDISHQMAQTAELSLHAEDLQQGHTARARHKPKSIQQTQPHHCQMTRPNTSYGAQCFQLIIQA
ncbi:hypothetical protein IRJ41_019961 [Triplophysa rosa]|uniref:Uncharacterized protein n=1 Tax=Triplophysa rosa TaxID=992332 RepID=A0A9W7TFG9_TRIRA|nr:hypothetical protein IRJ41_019961 [Triplophysa rosa]